MFVVVVNTNDGESRRNDSSLASWIGEDKEPLIEMGLAYIDSWTKQTPGRGYHLLVGELTEKVVIPLYYRVVPLDASAAIEAPKTDGVQ